MKKLSFHFSPFFIWKLGEIEGKKKGGKEREGGREERRGEKKREGRGEEKNQECEWYLKHKNRRKRNNGEERKETGRFGAI